MRTTQHLLEVAQAAYNDALSRSVVNTTITELAKIEFYELQVIDLKKLYDLVDNFGQKVITDHRIDCQVYKSAENYLCNLVKAGDAEIVRLTNYIIQQGIPYPFPDLANDDPAGQTPPSEDALNDLSTEERKHLDPELFKES